MIRKAFQGGKIDEVAHKEKRETFDKRDNLEKSPAPETFLTWAKVIQEVPGTGRPVRQAIRVSAAEVVTRHQEAAAPGAAATPIRMSLVSQKFV